MRHVQHHLTDVWTEIVSPLQFGVKGRSTAMATHYLQGYAEYLKESMDEATVALFDIRNAFGSLPHRLLFALLERHAFPQAVRQLLHHIYTTGRYCPVDGGPPFLSNCGVRQGCPVSVGLFLLGIDGLLQLIRHPFAIAFVDDIACLCPDPQHALNLSADISMLARRFNLQLNMKKTCLVTAAEDAKDIVHRLFGDEGPQVRNEGQHLGHPLTVP